jgi:hypothetical protein
MNMAAALIPIRAELNDSRARSKVKRLRKTAGPGKSGAGEHSADVMPIIREIQKSGAKSLWTIAAALNARGIKGARGGKWYATTVRKFIERHKTAATCAEDTA